MFDRRLLLGAVLLFVGVSTLFSDWWLTFGTFNLKGDWLSVRVDGDPLGLNPKVKVARPDLPVVTSLVKGDVVVARTAFETDSVRPITVPAGTLGVVMQVDAEGDAEIAFWDLGREWVYFGSFGSLGMMRATTRSTVSVVEGARAQLPGARPGAVAAPAVAQAAPARQAAPTTKGQEVLARPSSSYVPQIVYKRKECAKQVAELGSPSTPEECDELAAAEPGCGSTFMFSPEHPDWACRCCAPGGNGGHGSDHWNVYKVQTAVAASREQPKEQSVSKDTPSPVADAKPKAVAPSPPGGAKKKGGPYSPIIRHKKKECLEQVFELGAPQTEKECDELAATAPGCGRTFMFSPEHTDWKCRCCASEGADGGPSSEHWNVYEVQTEAAPEPQEEQAGSKDKYTPNIYAKQQGCDEQAFNFGKVATAAKCDALVSANPKCGAHFMFSRTHPDWECRCCTRSGADDGEFSPFWDVYAVQGPIPDDRKPVVAAGILDPTIGLPVASGPRPDWLLKEDALVIDARPQQKGGILILQAVLMDASKEWGKKQGYRPRWLRAILATNREHARRHGHAMVLRVKVTEPQLQPWQIRNCGKKTANQCRKDNERENYNWEKHLMLAEYLKSTQEFSHVLMLDADAALIRPELDTLRTISGILETKGKDLFLTDEDWRQYGKGMINGGLIMAKNTEFTRRLFEDTFNAHVAGPAGLKTWQIGVRGVTCSSNEQICLNDLWQGGRGPKFSDHTMMEGGIRWNHGAEVGGFDDPKVEILHFMGGAKSSAGRVLCDGSQDVTGEGKDGYGCQD